MSSNATDITQVYERNQEATVYCGNLDSRVDDEVLWELFVQCGPIRNVFVPRDKISGNHQGFGFVEFQTEGDSDYALKVMNMVKLYGKPCRLNKASQDKRQLEVGANLFIGNLDVEVDEKLLHDTFSAFGTLLSWKIMRDAETGSHRGFGFVAYESFESSDAALRAMNGQFMCSKAISVSYAYKKDTKGERHGTDAERILAANRPDGRVLGAPTGPTPLASMPPLGPMVSQGHVPGFPFPPLMPPMQMPPAMPGTMPRGMPPLPGLPAGMPRGMPPLPGLPPLNMPPHMPPLNMPPLNMPPLNMPPLNMPPTGMPQGAPPPLHRPPQMPPQAR
ncbi:MAG: hypothetical protein KVP17_002819 [Porospora cf. gigantea B]|uniref:uncharacterized protein n=2 Tax=Porospora cf. gigantea B TaxID=2853592 RepID=UPI003571A50C|nr:MAG: hypothetical protein KVP17_002819 [Porospora cf. gigantea B]